MRKTNIGVVLALALSFVLVLAVLPASAKGKPKPPGPEAPTTEPCKTFTSKPVKGLVDYECDWTPEGSSEWPSGEGIVTVKTTKGVLTHLAIFVRDSSPGDICVLEQFDKPIADEVEARFPLVFQGESYWEAPIHWCERFDEVGRDLNGEPLHLRVVVRAKRGTEVEISLTPGQSGGSDA